MTKKLNANLASTPAQYTALGLTPGSPALHEDGIHINGHKGTFEWWYFDSKLSDGSSLVIVFQLKSITSVSDGFTPYATIEYNGADGTEYKGEISASFSQCNFSEKKCDVTIGKCYFKGDLHTYEIHYEDENINANVTLTGNVPAWRPETGHLYFGDKDYFAWLPAVPEGNVHAHINLKGAIINHSGSGYHDHNWGNAPMQKVMHHWYWGRAKVEDYVVITAYITAEKKYGYTKTPVFLLAKNGEILGEDAAKYVTFKQSKPFFNNITQKHVHEKLEYEYTDGKSHYRITYHREGDLVNSPFINNLKGLKKTLLKLVGFDGAYHRIYGNCTIEKFENGLVVESVSAPAIWELMYFGKDMDV